MHAEQAAIRPRNPGVSFDEPIPRYWFGDIAVATHIANGVNLLFPAGERFFIRSVRHYLDRIDDPTLVAQVKGFFGQEGRHAQAHERFFEVMKEQGYEVDRFLAFYQRVAYDFIEPISSPELRLATTVALEHYTAILAENAFEDKLLDLAHPEMRRLLYWHAAEEIEHKAVAFDVLKKVNPSYALRVGGLAVGTACLVGFWIAATAMLLWHDKSRGRDLAVGAWQSLPHRKSIGKRVFWRGIKEYLRRDFHPSQNDNRHLASEYLASVGMA